MAKAKFTSVTQAGASHYDVLGVEPTDSLTDIRRAYLRIAQKTHPDRTIRMQSGFAKASYEDEIREANTAYSVLKNAESRAAYDKHLASIRPMCRVCRGKGKVQQRKGFKVTTVTCPECDGVGKK